MKTMTFLASKRGYVLVALALLGALVGAGADTGGFGSGDW
jgi:hypothetical protein